MCRAAGARGGAGYGAGSAGVDNGDPAETRIAIAGERSAPRKAGTVDDMDMLLTGHGISPGTGAAAAP